MPLILETLYEVLLRNKLNKSAEKHIERITVFSYSSTIFLNLENFLSQFLYFERFIIVTSLDKKEDTPIPFLRNTIKTLLFFMIWLAIAYAPLIGPEGLGDGNKIKIFLKIFMPLIINNKIILIY